MKIDRFEGDDFFLSNFYECPVEYEGLTYPSAEHAFQAAKVMAKKTRKKFLTGSPAAAKKRGRTVRLREDWEEIKIDVMTDIVIAKFMGNPDLGNLLFATGDAELIEGNWRGDTFWGVSNGRGENHLGKILMRVRDLITEHMV